METYYSFPVVPMAHGIQFIFKEFDYSNFVVTKRGLNAPLRPEIAKTRSIQLPFPKTLTDANNVRVVSFERDFLTARIASALSSETGTAAGQAVTDVAKTVAANLQGIGQGIGQEGVFNSLKNALTRITGTSSAGVANAARLASFMIRSFIPESISKTVSTVTGNAINPNETLAFEGVDLKNYSFSWELYPNNKQDSELIRQIVRLVKREALPRYDSGGLGSLSSTFASAGIDVSRIFLKYPSVVTINLIGVDELHWMRFKPAMITSVAVDYGSGGTVAIVRGGRPAGVTLTISFSELSIHTAEDYDYGSYFGISGVDPDPK